MNSNPHDPINEILAVKLEAQQAWKEYDAAQVPFASSGRFEELSELKDKAEALEHKSKILWHENYCNKQHVALDGIQSFDGHEPYINAWMVCGDCGIKLDDIPSETVCIDELDEIPV
jgi:hypothetical protein